jgi:hypothetical protein
MTIYKLGKSVKLYMAINRLGGIHLPADLYLYCRWGGGGGEYINQQMTIYRWGGDTLNCK